MRLFCTQNIEYDSQGLHIYIGWQVNTEFIFSLYSIVYTRLCVRCTMYAQYISCLSLEAYSIRVQVTPEDNEQTKRKKEK